MTAQVAERISFEGIELPLLAEPEIPTQHPRICVVPKDQAAKDNPMIGSTACWRGYIGEWAVRQGVLYLVDIKGIYHLLPGPDIPATWFTGTLRMPTGAVQHYVHGGYLSRYESEFFAEVQRGIIVRIWNEFNEPPEIEA